MWYNGVLSDYRNNVAPQLQLRKLQAWMNIKAGVFKNGIYIIYMGFCRAISNSLAPQPRHFFFVLGLRPRTKKKCLGFGAILLDIALQNPIYTLHIHHPSGLYTVLFIFNRFPPSTGRFLIFTYSPQLGGILWYIAPVWGLYIDI